MKVLVVDDNATVGRSMLRLLAARGHVPVYVESVGEARQALQAEPFDFILSDVMMPGETGADLHKWLVQHQPQMAGRLAFLTGGIFDSGVSSYIQASGRDCFCKVEFVTQVGAYLQSRPAVTPPPTSRR
ncbi:response regulator [Deltaproteobacteria bacterium]|nr:response regulator [Deltaproteobacteria bacterium]